MTARDLDLRAADADRERIAERLRTGHAEGRLDLAELQERLERAYAAKTLGDLRALVRDLPGGDVRAARRPRGRFRPPLVPILIALVVISAASGHHVFWLWIPLVFLVWRMSWWPRRRPWPGGGH